MNQYKRKRFEKGFTLIEVLIALSIIAISLTALLKNISQNISTTQRVHDKVISHFVAMQGVTMVQLGLLPINSQGSTQATDILNQRWYWRIKANPTPIKKVQAFTVVVSKNQVGPFQEALKAFHYQYD